MSENAAKEEEALGLDFGLGEYDRGLLLTLIFRWSEEIRSEGTRLKAKKKIKRSEHRCWHTLLSRLYVHRMTDRYDGWISGLRCWW